MEGPLPHLLQRLEGAQSMNEAEFQNGVMEVVCYLGKRNDIPTYVTVPV